MPGKILIKLIRVYQLTLSSLFGNRCRFYPTCSQYAQEAISRYGVFKGCYYGVRRILRCHPWHPGGYDPVPDPDGTSLTESSSKSSTD